MKKKAVHGQVQPVVSHDFIYDFALRIATAINDLRSSHSYFIIQKGFGEIDWSEVEKILNQITTCCNCKNCKKIKESIIHRFN